MDKLLGETLLAPFAGWLRGPANPASLRKAGAPNPFDVRWGYRANSAGPETVTQITRVASTKSARLTELLVESGAQSEATPWSWSTG